MLRLSQRSWRIRQPRSISYEVEIRENETLSLIHYLFFVLTYYIVKFNFFLVIELVVINGNSRRLKTVLVRIDHSNGRLGGKCIFFVDIKDHVSFPWEPNDCVLIITRAINMSFSSIMYFVVVVFYASFIGVAA